MRLMKILIGGTNESMGEHRMLFKMSIYDYELQNINDNREENIWK